MTLLQELQYVLDFTDVYRAQEDIYLREAACLKLQVPNMLAPLGEEDRVAGRMPHRFVGFRPQEGGLYTYYTYEAQVQAAMKACAGELPAVTRERLAETLRVWEQERTLDPIHRRFRVAGVQVARNHN